MEKYQFIKTHEVIGTTSFCGAGITAVDAYGYEHKNGEKYLICATRPDGRGHRLMVRDDRYGGHVTIAGQCVYIGEFVKWDYK